MTARPCLSCGAPVPRRQKCQRCTRPNYNNAERARRAEVVSAWRARFGDWCPGHGVPAHHSADLTADHVTPVAYGGRESGPLTVLCRSCNGRRGGD